jgi:hypothetical protein
VYKCLAISSHLQHPCGGALLEVSKELVARLKLVELAWYVPSRSATLVTIIPSLPKPN